METLALIGLAAAIGAATAGLWAGTVVLRVQGATFDRLTSLVGLQVLACFPLGFLFGFWAPLAAIPVFILSTMWIMRERLLKSIGLWLFSVAPVVFLATALPNCLEASINKKPRQASKDLRTIATALESYHLDHGFYPACSVATEGDASAHSTAWWAPTLEVPLQLLYRPEGLSPAGAEKSTPEPYLSESPVDPFAPPGMEGDYAYWVHPDNSWWVLWSPGPNGLYDLTAEDLQGLEEAATRDDLISFVYDSTNGIHSDGDILSIGQPPRPWRSLGERTRP